MRRHHPAGIILTSFLLLSLTATTAAAAPLAVRDARQVRPLLVEQARRYLGAPYRSGGEDPSGFDCSGLVYRVYADVLGRGVPRTVRALYRASERVPPADLEEGDLVFFNTTGPLSHIGIYIGDSRIVHAASEGRRAGVIISSLEEPYYRSRYAGAGRLIPSAGWIGFQMRVGAAPLLGAEGGLVRGGGLIGQAWYDLFGHNIGLEMHLEYDAALHVVSLPMLVNVALGRRFWILGGLTLSAGSGELAGSGSTRRYRPDDDMLFNTLGVGLELASFRVGGTETCLFSELSYTHHEPVGGTPPEYPTDLRVGWKAYLGAAVKLRY